jgi:hypothetical protein
MISGRSVAIKPETTADVPAIEGFQAISPGFSPPRETVAYPEAFN